MKRITDPSFRYIPASDHADSRAFHRRQQERKRIAQARAAEVAVKVTPLPKRKEQA